MRGLGVGGRGIDGRRRRNDVDTGLKRWYWATERR
jgi:hypothetical protein